jgi:phage anti-repressor protein
MNQLITITENNGNKAVSARELHQFLEVGKDFSNWIKSRIAEYGFVENEDFSLLANFGEQNQRGGHNRKEYALSLDMAKELAMVEKNDKGKQARRYFIAVEKQATQPQPLKIGTKQERQLQHYALMDAIKKNLVRGDVVDVATQHGFNRSITENVMRCRTNNPTIIKALFDRAMHNKKTLLLNTQIMINQLNQ